MRLEDMTWEQRFMAAWDALLKMEARAERAEAELHPPHVEKPLLTLPAETAPRRRGRPPNPKP